MTMSISGIFKSKGIGKKQFEEAQKLPGITEEDKRGLYHLFILEGSPTHRLTIDGEEFEWTFREKWEKTIKQ